MSDGPVLRFDDGDESLTHALEAMRDVLMRHPIAAQAAFAALVSEGRRFSATPDGAAWKERLAGSELLDGLRTIWDAASMTAFVERPVDVLPSFFVDAALRAASEAGLEPLLSRLFDERE